MAFDEGALHEQVNSLKVRLQTCQENQDRIKEKFRSMMETLGAKERGDGSVVIDFVKLAGNLSLEHALELRAAIDEAHRISGAAGEKPRVRLALNV